MLKTYLYVPDELNREVEALATAGKTSKAAVIRSALDAGVKMLKRKKVQVRNISNIKIMKKKISVINQE